MYFLLDIPDKMNCLQSSFARFMSSQGFDTWILEVRGAGLSNRGVRSAEVKKPGNGPYSMDQMPDADARGRGTEMVKNSNKSQLVTKLTETIADWSENLSGWLNGQSILCIPYHFIRYQNSPSMLNIF